MGELITADVLDWARDLAAMNKLLAGEQVERSRPLGPAKVFCLRARNADGQLSAAPQELITTGRDCSTSA